MMKGFARVLLGIALASSITAGARAGGMVINGAGSTFAFPVFAKWAEAYSKETGVRLNYQSIGSGGGVKQIKAKTVDFGASDAPLKPEELEKHGLVQWPQIMGGVVPVYNLPGVKAGELKLTPQLLADIYLGKIRKWNDPAIAKVNPDLKLPGLRITVIRRSDGSGTTFIFTNYLAKVSEEWKKRVGFGKAVSWPTGIGGKGNEGVASYVLRVKGGIGYVEFAYALQKKLAYVTLQNRAGTFVAPTIETFQAAAAGADWEKAKGYYLMLTDQPGEKAWPITGATFVLVHETAEKQERTREVLKFFDWAFRKGDEMAVKLDYVPMPPKVVEMVEKTWAAQIHAADGKALWQAPAEAQ